MTIIMCSVHLICCVYNKSSCLTVLLITLFTFYNTKYYSSHYQVNYANRRIVKDNL